MGFPFPDALLRWHRRGILRCRVARATQRERLLPMAPCRTARGGQRFSSCREGNSNARCLAAWLRWQVEPCPARSSVQNSKHSMSWPWILEAWQQRTVTSCCASGNLHQRRLCSCSCGSSCHYACVEQTRCKVKRENIKKMSKMKKRKDKLTTSSKNRY